MATLEFYRFNLEQQAKIRKEKERAIKAKKKPRTWLSAVQTYRPVPPTLFSSDLEVLKKKGGGIYHTPYQVGRGTRKVDTPTAYRNGSLADEPLGVGGYCNSTGVQSVPPSPAQDYSPHRADTKLLMSQALPALDRLSTGSDSGWWARPTDAAGLKARLQPGRGDLGHVVARDGYRGYMGAYKHLACMSAPGVYGECGGSSRTFGSSRYD